MRGVNWLSIRFLHPYPSSSSSSTNPITIYRNPLGIRVYNHIQGRNNSPDLPLPSFSLSAHLGILLPLMSLSYGERMWLPLEEPKISRFFPIRFDQVKNWIYPVFNFNFLPYIPLPGMIITPTSTTCLFFAIFLSLYGALFISFLKCPTLPFSHPYQKPDLMLVFLCQW